MNNLKLKASQFSVHADHFECIGARRVANIKIRIWKMIKELFWTLNWGIRERSDRDEVSRSIKVRQMPLQGSSVRKERSNDVNVVAALQGIDQIVERKGELSTQPMYQMIKV